MKIWFDRARAMEADPGVVQISNFPMQPWLDVDEGGWATVVITDGDAGLADRLADELADLAWSMKEQFQIKSSLPPSEAVAEASSIKGLVTLSDTGDSVLGGAGGDSTVLLDIMFKTGIDGPALVPVVDPLVAVELLDREVGDTVSVLVGGRVAKMHDAIQLSGTLLLNERVTVEIGDGYASPLVDLGATAVIDTEVGVVVITELPGLGGVHPDMYEGLGINPTEFKMVVVKTASNFQYFNPIASAVVRADTPGPTQSDIASLPWKRVPRPIFPLDAIEERR